jgi:oligoendopeptidase F
MPTKNKSNLRTEWNLELMYKSPLDPQIYKDVEKVEGLLAAFEKKYKGNTFFLEDEDALLFALTEYEELQEKATWKPIMYLNYCTDLNSANTDAESLKNKLMQQLIAASNKVLFFSLALGKIKPENQKKFLGSKRLAHFKYFLKIIFDTAKHDLTEAEEKIMNLKYLPSRGMWVDGVEKLVSSQTITFERKRMALSAAFGRISELPVSKRRKLHRLATETLKSISDFSESEINALYTDKKINDELRGFKEPYEATILSYQNNKESIVNLVETVTRNNQISHRFYALKAKLMKLKSLEYADRSANIGKQSAKVTFDEAVEILKRSLGRLDTDTYIQILEKFINEGRIDVYPKKGKRGGAYCSSAIGSPTYVLLNHVDSIDSVMTFGHEMGHAFHSELSKNQSPMYQDYVISVAEVASTFFENIVFEEIFEKLSPKEKVIALHDRLNDDIATIFRQIACFNFELELHHRVRAEGFVSKDEIAKIHNKHMSAYLGPKVKMHPDDGYMFVSWSHIRNHFYVYSYAYGQLISKALYNKYKRDPKFIFEIEKFLSAGGSKSPEDIFKDIGIDTTKPDFFMAGLREVEEGIKNLEKLVR